MAPTTTAPGIHLMKSDVNSQKDADKCGSYRIWCNGVLSSKALGEKWNVYFNGLLFRDHSDGISDAAHVLSQFEIDENIEKIAALKGSFNIIIIRNDGSKGCIVNDLLCSRSWYWYSNDSVFGASPTPMGFIEAGYPTTLSSQALYEMIRLLHTGFDRTLVSEIKRFLHGEIIRFDENGLSERTYTREFTQDIDNSITTEQAAKWMIDICEAPIRAIKSHPHLNSLPIRLPLTGGFDSRQILGILLDLDKKPASLRHITITNEDSEPVRNIAESMQIPLQEDNLYDLDTRDLVSRWIDRSGGLVSFHQYYLLQLKNDGSTKGDISFNGYLMDLLLGIAIRGVHASDEMVFNNVWNRRYTGKSILKLLFPNESRLKSETKALFEEEFKRYKGDPRFRMMMLDLHHRSLQYVGILDSMLGDEAISFSPGAHPESLDFAMKVSHSVAGDKKAKLLALKKWYADVAKYPYSGGVDIYEKEVSAAFREHPVKKSLRKMAKFVLNGFSPEAYDNSEHVWLRKSKDLKAIHQRLVDDSALVRDGHLSGFGVQVSWNIHLFGGYQAWTLMSILSAEVSYRVLVRRESKEDVIKWLFSRT
jgi:hypothetical protein